MMYGSGQTFYPMLAVGAFFSQFWVGFVVAHELGFACDGMLICGLLLGGFATYVVTLFERGERRPQRPATMSVAAPGDISGLAGSSVRYPRART